MHFNKFRHVCIKCGGAKGLRQCDNVVKAGCCTESVMFEGCNDQFCIDCIWILHDPLESTRVASWACMNCKDDLIKAADLISAGANMRFYCALFSVVVAAVAFAALFLIL